MPRDPQPWGWLRHITPWLLLAWLDRRNPQWCWANIVSWKMYGERSWGIGGSCWDGPAGREHDYCGKHETRESFAEATHVAVTHKADAE